MTDERHDRTLASDVALVHPATGEVQELNAPDHVLAELLLAVRNRQTVLKKTRDALEQELAARMRVANRTILTAGTVELRLERRNESVWDAFELEATLGRLIEQQIIRPSETVGIIRHETTVSKSAANRLAKTLTADARQAVEACRHWQQSASARLDVTRSIDLIPGSVDSTAVEET